MRTHKFCCFKVLHGPRIRTERGSAGSNFNNHAFVKGLTRRYLGTELSCSARVTEDLIKQIEIEWGEAFERRDMAALDRFMAGEYVVTDPLGNVRSKAESLAAIESSEVHFESTTSDNVHVRINGDLFSSVVAFSPGFVIDGAPHSKPRIFISHGINDSILPIDRCGRRIASGLNARGYDVTFREFDGDHEIPGDILREGLRFV